VEAKAGTADVNKDATTSKRAVFGAGRVPLGAGVLALFGSEDVNGTGCVRVTS